MEIDPFKTFMFSPWWDPTVKVAKNTAPLIHQKVQELRREVGGLKAEKAQFGPSFPVKSAKELEMKLQPALDKCSLTMTVRYEIHYLSPSEIPVTKNKKGDDVVTRSACWVVCTARLCAEDGSWIESQGAGGGMDGDDKALGKATTYSRKDAVMKMLAVPDENMIDTDDEEKPGVKAKDMERAIADAVTVADLDALLPQLRALSTDKQLKLSAPYAARRKALTSVLTSPAQ